MSIDNFFIRPTIIEDNNFCRGYINLSELYWNIADKDIMNAINSALQQILLELYSGKDIGMYNGMSEAQIKKIFVEKKIRIISQIPESVREMVEKDMSQYLFSHKDSAQRCGMKIPQKNVRLLVAEYYENYLKAINYLKRLDLIMKNEKEKKYE